MEFNKNIVLVFSLSILLLSFHAEGSWFRLFKHVSSSKDVNVAPSYAPGPSPFPASHISSSPSSSIEAPTPESNSPYISPDPEPDYEAGRSHMMSVTVSHLSASPDISPAPKADSESISLSPVSASSPAQESVSPVPSPASGPSALDAFPADVKLPCGASDDIWTCVRSISSVMNSNGDPYSILKTGIQAAIAQTKQLISTADADAQGCSVDNAVDDLEESLKAADGHDMGRLVSALQAAQEDVTNCGGSSGNESLNQLIKNCLTITEAVELSNLNF